MRSWFRVYEVARITEKINGSLLSSLTGLKRQSVIVIFCIVMERIIVHGYDAEGIPNYNCSIANLTLEDFYARGVIKIPAAIYSLIYGTVAEVTYIFVMMAMWRLRKSFGVYNIMINLGFYDMMDIFVNSLVTGYLHLVGGSFCTHPNLIYITGSLGLALWCGECLCCLILVFNRIVDLFSSEIHQTLFGGYKMDIWLCMPFGYCMYFLLFTNPVLFNSALDGWFFSPFILNTWEEAAKFSNYGHAFNNIAVVATTCFFYIAMCYLVISKYGGMAAIGNAQRMVIIQSIFVCTANLGASGVYVYMQFFPAPEWVIFMGHLCWQLANGIPAFVYLILNKTVRRIVLEILGLRKPLPRGVTSSSQVKSPAPTIY